MPKRSSKRPEREDPNEAAYRIIREATEEDDDGEAEGKPESATPKEDERPPEKNAAAVALGRLGGKKGGPARAKKLTPDERSEIARLAAVARWRKSKGRPDKD